MKRAPILRPVPCDALVVLAVVVLAAALYVFPLRAAAAPDTGRQSADTQNTAAPLTAVVYIDSVETDRIELTEGVNVERDYTAHGITLHAVFTEGGAQVTHSECPTQVCVLTGRVTHSGQAVICLPAGIIIHLEGGEDGGADVYLR